MDRLFLLVEVWMSLFNYPILPMQWLLANPNRTLITGPSITETTAAGLGEGLSRTGSGAMGEEQLTSGLVIIIASGEPY